MDTILAAISTTRKKGLKPSFVAGKQVRDQMKKLSKEAGGQEGDGRSPIKDNEKNKMEEVLKKNY